ncbi:Sarcosine oxidase [Purpureocillium takamizusanense]|uniref:Sarcosine oxidase n=1 Tax=Purpureocillium takamizusanense TaxID=2060973 RepID=A0A9Q8Q7E8_9HYPO|nr:Sarcosine oxidase [Purpureocillium takamizusanense]UNI14460.1 Sarcosine oxidase [Purpureocillium takamizusanense]
MDQGIESGLGEENILVGGCFGRSDSLGSPLSRVIPAPQTKGGEMALPPSHVETPARSRDASSERCPETAPAIKVWEEDAGIDDSGLSSLQMDIGPSDEDMSQDNDGVLFQAADEDGIVDSFTSSLSALTELSDVSSLKSASSSKATTPAEAESTRSQQNDGQARIFTPLSYHHGIDRLNFTVLPKSSIPTDIPPHQYAAECIEAAESSRLNPYALHPDEYHLLRHHISHSQVTTYLNLRNRILRIWIRRPWACVTRQEAVGCASARWFDAASVCYDWLVRRGYINFGCVALPETLVTEHDMPRVKRRKTVAVVGAGISGLACARQLEGLFKQHADRYHDGGEEIPRVVVVEGRRRVGGRVYSREFRSKPINDVTDFNGKRHTAEMGGMIITGFNRGNPMNVLVRGQLGLPYHTLSAETTIYDSNGKPVDPVRDELVERLYNDCLDRVSEYKFKPQPSKLIEGNRDLLDEGRDSQNDGNNPRSIMQVEEATAALPHAPPVSQQSVPEKVNMVPVSADKLTGRVHTEPGVPGTLRASDKAKIMGWNLRPGASNDPDIDLVAAAAREEATLGSLLDFAITQYRQLVDLNPQDHRLINWHIANLEYSNATNLHNLSLGLWDIDAGNEWEGHHTMVVGGYQSVARGLLRCPSMLDLTSNFPVSKIKYHSEDFTGPACIESEDGRVIEADCVICTVPLGVLKQGNITFDPPLPAWKTDAIERLGFGVLNKVVLVYDKVFWEQHRHIFGVLRDAPNRHSTLQKDYGLNRGRFFQWFNVTSTTGLPCLIALMAGDAGFETEHSSNDQLISEATEILRSVFGKEVPYPVESVVTRWGSDRFARGSYSSAASGMLPDDYDTMSRGIGNLLFAGEHTIGTHPATVHGAYLSGLRAASEVLEAMLGPVEVPTPLILPRDSLLLHKRKEAAKDPRQARLEAYEVEVWDFIRLQIGERPARPNKVAGNAYLLYSKAHFEDAKKRCEENRKTGKTRSLPNEVRMMTSKMWKEATPEERKPFEDEAALQKRAYSEAMQIFNDESQKWDQRAMSLRATYEKEHPFESGDGDAAYEARLSHKHRRARHVSYVEGQPSEMDR